MKQKSVTYAPSVPNENLDTVCLVLGPKSNALCLDSLFALIFNASPTSAEYELIFSIIALKICA